MLYPIAEFKLGLEEIVIGKYRQIEYILVIMIGVMSSFGRFHFLG